MEYDGSLGKKVILKSKRLPTFCFMCALIGHGEKICKRNYEVANGVVARKYGLELCAQCQRNQKLNVNKKWLMPPPVIGVSDSGKGTVNEKRGNNGNVGQWLEI